jgi:hypothetical protein
MKKAQGISVNTIIVTAIALVVLVVLIAVFTGRISLFGKDLSEVQKGSICKSDSMKVVKGFSCEDGWEAIYSNIKQCREDEDPESIGCLKTGYICCSRKG